MPSLPLGNLVMPVIFFLLAALNGCVVVKPDSIPHSASVKAPLYDAVSITGLVFRDQRVAQRVKSIGFGSAMGGVYGNRGSAFGSGIASGQNQSVVWEAYDNHDLEETLRHAVEDTRMAKRVIEGVPVVLEGSIIRMKPSSGPGWIAWDVFNTITLIGIFGTPYIRNRGC